MTSKHNYPSHLIDPKDKGKLWVLSYLKAAWSEFSQAGYQSFYTNRNNYAITKTYAQGNQSINKYKPLMGEEADADTSYLNIDWNVIPILPKFRRMALKKMSKMDYNISADPIDPLAQDEKNSHFAKLKAKIKIREDFADNPMIANNPMLQMGEGEPEDMEELAVQENYTWKHNAAIEMEMAINVVFNHNKMERIREGVREDLFDYGIGGVRECLDSNGAVKIRKVNIPALVVNHCSKPDFSDLQHVGEVIELTIADLKQMAGEQFSSEQYLEIAEEHVGKLGNPSVLPDSGQFQKGFDKFKVKVLDMEFFSVNTMVHEKRIDKRNNKRFGRANYYAKSNRRKKVKRTSFKVLYKGCWILGTEFVFNSGLVTDMKRVKNNLTDTTSSYHLQALDFHNMRAVSYMEGAIPIADNIQIAWYKMQSAIAEARPKGIQIEMGALEDVPLGSGGTKLSPMQVLDLYHKKGILVYRKVDISGRATNYKPIEELQNGLGSDAMNYFALIQQNMQLLRDILGLNELTDGSTPDARTLNYVARLATEGTNNALAPITDADRFMIEDVASDIVLRIQDTLKRSPIQGYVRSLGSKSVKFFKATPSLNNWNFGISISLKASQDQKQRLIEYLNLSVGKENLDMEDITFIETIDNIKLAYQVLSHRIKKRRKIRQQEEMQRQQMNGQIQVQSAQSAEQSKQQTLQIEFQMKAELEKLKAQNQENLLKLKLEGEMAIKQMEIQSNEGIKLADLESSEYKTEYTKPTQPTDSESDSIG